MNLKGSKTEANLMAAFAGESQARNKYMDHGRSSVRKSVFLSSTCLGISLSRCRTFLLYKKIPHSR